MESFRDQNIAALKVLFPLQMGENNMYRRLFSNERIVQKGKKWNRHINSPLLRISCCQWPRFRCTIILVYRLLPYYKRSTFNRNYRIFVSFVDTTNPIYVLFVNVHTICYLWYAVRFVGTYIVRVLKTIIFFQFGRETITINNICRRRSGTYYTT